MAARYPARPTGMAKEDRLPHLLRRGFVHSSERSAIGRAARASRFGVSEEMTNERILAECPRIVKESPFPSLRATVDLGFGAGLRSS